jgi:hypothetical protein
MALKLGFLTWHAICISYLREFCSQGEHYAAGAGQGRKSLAGFQSAERNK